MSTRDTLAMSLLSACMISPATLAADAPRLGEPADPARIAAWSIDVSPDGAGLPPGRGSVQEGANIFAVKCEGCHGTNGIGKPADRLTGGIGTLTSTHPIKTVASYWPYATTLFAYIRGSMPITNPRSLSADETYALCAYLLSIDGIVAKDAVLNAQTLPKVRMPNAHGFRDVWEASPHSKR
jgi:cytochrome c